MTYYIPDSAWSKIMSFLHKEYDFEKQAVVDELAYLIQIARNTDTFFTPAMLLPNAWECTLCNLASKYRNNHNQTRSDVCTCVYCRLCLWNRY